MKTPPLFIALATCALAQPSATAPAYLPRPATVPLSAAVQEKLAAMRPIFDGRSLEGWIQAPVAPIRFAGEDVKDARALVHRFTAKSDGVAAWLAEQFDEAGRAALAAYAATADAKTNQPHLSALLRNINRLVGGDVSLFDATRFRGVTLRPATLALRQRNPRGVDLARLNRLLLEDAFPTEFAPSPSSAWVVKDGALASTGAGRGVIYTKEDFTHYRVVFQVRQISGNHVPGVLVFGERPASGELGRDALGAVQFQVPRGGHWDYRPGFNKAGDKFTRPVRIDFSVKEWAQVELLVNAKTGAARMAVAQPVGTKAIEILRFADTAAGRPGPFALQMHNAGLFDEFRELRVEIDPKEDRLLTVE